MRSAELRRSLDSINFLNLSTRTTSCKKLIKKRLAAPKLGMLWVIATSFFAARTWSRSPLPNFPLSKIKATKVNNDNSVSAALLHTSIITFSVVGLSVSFVSLLNHHWWIFLFRVFVEVQAHLVETFTSLARFCFSEENKFSFRFCNVSLHRWAPFSKWRIINYRRKRGKK